MSKQPTKAESERMDKMARSGCVVCRISFGAYVDAEIQHLTSGGRRIGHGATIPLCSWHHRGVPTNGMSQDYMKQIYGPTFAKSRREFEAAFGTEEQLLEEVNRWLGYSTNPDSPKSTASSSQNSTTSESSHAET